MILIENAQIMGLEPTIRGMRNPMNSWAKSDSGPCLTHGPAHCKDCPYTEESCHVTEADLENNFIVGPNDLDLMLRLARAGSVDGKFRRMIAVYVDITAPLYWWKEFDTYKVGTVANSCSTMHKIHAKEFTLEDFSHEHLNTNRVLTCYAPTEYHFSSLDLLKLKINCLNYWREKYLELSKIDESAWRAAPKASDLTDESLIAAKKNCWWQMIQLLPSSYNQKRTVMLNYEVLSNIYQHRRNHKLNEWRELCKWIEGLPYSEVITCNAAKQEEDSSIVAAITKLKNEQWSTEDIVALLLGQTKKEYMKLFSDDTDKMPVHGGAFEIPAVMADNTKND
mgnify:CR=1 FL=1